MATPLPTGKQSVDLAAPAGARVSIRRDPPLAVKELEVRDQGEHDTRTVLIGILAFTLALLIIGMAISSYVGWSPRSYIVRV